MPKYTTKETGNVLSLEASIRKIKYKYLWLKIVSFMRVCTENLCIGLLIKREKGWMLGYVSILQQYSKKIKLNVHWCLSIFY